MMQTERISGLRVSHLRRGRLDNQCAYHNWPKKARRRAATEEEMLRPCSDEALTIWPVGKAVGNVKNTGSRLLMPVEAARKPDHIHAMLVSLETLWGVGENKNDDRSETQNSSRQEWPRQAQAAGRGAGRSPQEYLSGIRSNFGRTARPRPARIGGLVNALTTPGEIREERRKR